MENPVPAPLCFVLMPFGRQTLPSGVTVDFDTAYRDTIAPAVTAAGLQPVRADQGRPAFRFFHGLPPSELSRLSTDVFRDRIPAAEDARQTLEVARCTHDPARVREAAAALGPLESLDAGTLVDLLLSYRAVKEHQAMVDLVAQLPEAIAQTRLVQEQLGFALNRLGRRDEAEAVLQAVIARHGPSGESNGLLGRIYKDRWEAAVQAGDAGAARRWLDQAIATYLQGFEVDWRDAYPGVNAATLMELTTPPDPRRLALLPVVAYAVERRIAAGAPDYWDHATLLELAVLREDESAAARHLADALAAVREPWEPETTARNLWLIRAAWAARGVVQDWLDATAAALRR